jgi:hypothetical protein
MPMRSSEYIVKFEVGAWWKGSETREVQVLWRTAECSSYFSVGEKGERYLVYADPSRRKEGVPEVTVANRTSKIAAEPPVLSGFELSSQSRRPVRFGNPELNRHDASADVLVLRWLKACGCLASASQPPCMDPFANLRSDSSNSRSDSAASCCSCLPRSMNPLW